MKKIISLAVVLFISFSICLSQKSDSLICKMIKDSIPAGWSVKLDKGIITVIKKDSVWFFNGINAPLELTPSDHPPFGAYKGIYKMEIKVQAGWSQKQMRSAVKKNSTLMNQAYEKYKMSTIDNKNGDFAPKNDDEQKRVEAYYKACELLQSQLIIIPTINAEKNSYLIHTGVSETGFSIWPQKPSGEIYTTESKIYSILRK